MNEGNDWVIPQPQVIRRNDGSFHVLNVDLDSMSTMQRLAVAIDVWPQVKTLMEVNGDYEAPGRIGSRVTPGKGSYEDIHTKAAEAANVSRSTVSSLHGRASRRPDVVKRMRQDEFASTNDVMRELGFKVKPRLSEGVQQHPALYFRHGDKFEEATEPLIQYLEPWRNKGFKYPHVNPKEAQRRLPRLDELIDGLIKTREDISKRAHAASYGAPSERKKGER